MKLLKNRYNLIFIQILILLVSFLSFSKVAMASTKLTKLEVVGYKDQITSFNEDTLNYNINIYDNEVDLDLKYEKEDSDAKVKIEGNKYIKNNSTGTITVTVTKTGETQTTYTINYTKIPLVTNFEYIFRNSYYTLNVPSTNFYRIELWGATGAYLDNSTKKDKGSYTAGTIKLKRGIELYVFVGEKGNNARTEIFNGGGKGGYGQSDEYYGYSGGGATDVRLNVASDGSWSDFDSLKSRIMVAAGGAGGAGADVYEYAGSFGAAGGLTGYNGTYYSGHGNLNQFGKGASQTSGGGAGTNIYSGAYGETQAGSFGKGGDSNNHSSGRGAGGGGGGYYGGGAGGATGGGGCGNGAGGGSSFISGHDGCNAIKETSTIDNIIHSNNSVHYSGYTFTNTKMIDGYGYEWTNSKINSVVKMPTFDGSSLMVGNNDNGYAKITLLNYSNDNYLISLTADNGTFNKSFSPTENEYELTLDLYNQIVNFEVELSDNTAVVSGLKEYRAIPGTNTEANIIVTSETGETRIYKVIIKTPELPENTHSTKLSDLSILEYEMYPTFNPDNTEYFIDLYQSELDLTVNYTKYDSSAKVKIVGNKHISNDQNTITVTVTADDTETTVYTININRVDVEKEYPFNYAKRFQKFIAPVTGYYRVELWGANGGYVSGTAKYDKGGYTAGTIKLKKGEVLYIFTGESGNNSGTIKFNGGGYGGSSGSIVGQSGGGATDVRLYINEKGDWDDFESLKSRIMVAGGAGGTAGVNGPTHTYETAGNFSVAGGLVGYSGTYYYGHGDVKQYGTGGTQTSGGIGGINTNQGTGIGHDGSFGIGGNSDTYSTSAGAGGGGGGYYGGGAGGGTQGGGAGTGAGGGSSFISGHEGCLAVEQFSTKEKITHKTDSIHYSGYYFTDTKMIDGYGYEWTTERGEEVVGQPKSDGSEGTQIGNVGDGKARITLITSSKSKNNYLSELTIKNAKNYEVINYTPDFSYEDDDYNVTLGVDETKINIHARPEDSNATISGLGDYDIEAGTTEIPIMVTSESSEVRTYVIHVTRPASDNAYPTNITVVGLVKKLCGVNSEYCQLDRYDKDQHTYNVTVPARIKELYFSVEKGHDYQTVSGEGKVTLREGINTYVIEVESEDQNHHEIYTYNVTRDMTEDRDLGELKVINPIREINYEPDITTYYVEVPNSFSEWVVTENEEVDTEVLDKVQIYAKADYSQATYRVEGPTTLEVGQMNEIKIIVELNGVEREYTLNVYRQKNGNALLGKLEVENNETQEKYAIYPEFNKAYFGEYILEVENNIEEIKITAEPDAGTTGVSISGPISTGVVQRLRVGENRITITTNSEATTTEVYTLVVTRKKNNSTEISDIEVKVNGIRYGVDSFNDSILEYEVNVPEGTTEAIITASKVENTTSYRLLDNNVIQVGDNLKRVLVIAEDGSTRTFNIVIKRPANTDKTMKKITIRNSENNEELYTNEITTGIEEELIELEVENEVKKVIIGGEKLNNLSTVNGLGAYSLQVGLNEIKVKVISESGLEKEYTIKITRKANNNADLIRIETNKGNITVNDSDTEYTLEVDYYTEKINVKGIARYNETSVSGNGEYELSVGDNPITITTESEDTLNSKTYTLKVVRKPSDKKRINRLWMEEGVIKPSWNKDVEDGYTVKVPMNVTSGTFHIELEDPDTSSYAISGNSFEAPGEYNVNVVVTAMDSTTKTYTIKVIRQELTSNKLDSITIDGEEIAGFNPEVSYYKVIVPYNSTSVLVGVTCSDEEVEITGLGTKQLIGKTTFVEIEVTSLDGLTRGYTIELEKGPNNEARIREIEIENGTIDPGFNSEIISYNVETDEERLDISKIILMDSNATYEVRGNNFPSIGTYTMEIEVTAENNTTTKTYTFNVERTKNKNVYLSSLEVEGYSIEPTFSKTETNYRLNVGELVEQINIKATAEVSTSEVRGIGIKTVAVGKNRYEIEVESEYGNKKSYYVEVTKEGNHENRLREIRVLNGEMRPAFSSDKTEYQVEVGSSEERLIIEVELLNDKERYEIVGNTLKEGKNDVQVIVTSENGEIKVYTLHTTREKIDSTLLKSLEVKDYKINPEFNSYVNAYEVLVGYEIDELSKLEIIGEPIDKEARVSIIGSNELEEGNNEVIVRVEKGESHTDYTLTIKRQAYANTYLDYLNVVPGIMSPTFNKNTLKYKVEVESNVEVVEVYAGAEDGSANVRGLGEHNIDYGHNEIEVEVTALGGIKRTYIIDVIRKKSDDNNLYELEVYVDGVRYGITPGFRSEETNYKITVPKIAKKIKLEGRVNEYSSVEGLGEKDIIDPIEITVTAEDTSTKTYTIRVERAEGVNSELEELRGIVGYIEPELEDGIVEYIWKVPRETSKITKEDIIAVPKDRDASVSKEQEVTLTGNNDKYTIIVTSEDGHNTTTYTLNIELLPSTIAEVEGIRVEKGKLEPAFSKTITEYDVYEYEDEIIDTITVNAKSEYASVVGDGEVDLTNETIRIVTVTSEDGENTTTYTLRFKRTIKRVENLSNIEINGLENLTCGSLSCALEPGYVETKETGYRVEVPNEYDTLDMTITKKDAQQTYKVKFDNEETSDNRLKVGTTLVTIEVYDGLGEKTNEYEIEVVRDDNHDDRLLSLSVDKGKIDPTFSSEVTEYVVHEYVDEEEIEISAEAKDGTSVVSGIGTVELDENPKMRTVTVTTKDGKSTPYVLTIVKDVRRVRGLSLIEVRGLGSITCGSISCELTPGYNETKETGYRIEVPYEYSTLDLGITKKDAQQTYKVKFDGNTTNDYKLKVGTTVVTVEVYDGCGVKTNEYEIEVIRHREYVNLLDGLSVSKGYYEPAFSSTQYEYDVYEYEDEESIEVAVQLRDGTSSIQGEGTVELDENPTIREIIVTTKDGKVKPYTLTIHKVIKKDRGLEDLGLNGLEGLNCSRGKCILTPEFNENETTYKITVPYEYTNLDVKYTKVDERQTVKIKVNDEYVNGYSLPIGKTNVEVEVYDGLGVLTTTYEIEVTRNKPSNTKVTEIRVYNEDKSEQYTLDPAFAENKYEYYITVGANVMHTVIEVEKEDPKAGVGLNGNTYLDTGENIATVTITAQDGTILTYVIHINKLGSNNAYLKNLFVSTGTFTDLIPEFDGTKEFEHTTTLSGSYDNVTIQGVAYDSINTEIKYYDEEENEVEDGNYDIKTGLNVIIIKTKNESNGAKTELTYKLNIIKQESRNVDLLSLKVGGVLIEGFDPGRTIYNIGAGENEETLDIEAKPKELGASVEIKGNEKLHSGENKILIIVKSKDKSASKTYQIIVNKDKSSDVSLKSVRVLKNGEDVEVTPTEITETTRRFYAEVDKNTSKVSILVEANNKFAEVKGNGEYSLNYGRNEKVIQVIAEDGSEEEYYVVVYRKYELDLLTIVTDKGEWEESFDATNSEKTEYIVRVNKDVEKIVVIAFAKSNKVTVDGSRTYELTPGENEIPIIVTAPDGDRKEYKLKVIKAADDNNYIKSLEVKENGIRPEFERGTQEYDVNVIDTTRNITLEVELESDKARYEIIGNENFDVNEKDEYEVIVRVYAENNETRDYKVIVHLKDAEYFEVKLKDLNVSEGSLTPDFNKNTNYYAVTVPSSIKRITITAEKMRESHIISGIGEQELKIGRNVFPVTVTNEEGNSNTYSVVVYRESSNDATLKSLAIKGESIMPLFTKETIEYTAYVGSDRTSLEIEAIPTDGGARVEIRGAEEIATGENIIKIEVTASDGVTKKEYTIKAIKQKSTNVYLKSLEVNGYEMQPAFDKTNSGPYRISVGAEVNSVLVEGIAEVSSTTVAGNNTYTLSKGENLITITTTAESGDTKVYTVIVSKDLNNDNTLKELLISEGTIEFDRETTEYNVDVASDVEEVTVIGFANVSTSTVSGNGTYTLKEEGITEVTIKVRSEAGIERPYIIRIRKSENTDSTKILSLVIKNGKLEPDFNKDTQQYIVKVPNEVNALEYEIELETTNARYEVIGNSGFTEGKNEVKFKVINGERERVYTIDVMKQGFSSNYLSSLGVEGYTISPRFEKEVMYYTLKVGKEVEKVKIIGEKEDATSAVSGLGEVTLNEGINRKYVIVTSSSGIERAYQIEIERERKNKEGELLTLTTDKGIWNREYNKEIKEYVVTVEEGVEEITIQGTYSEGTIVEGLGTYTVIDGEEKEIIVKNERLEEVGRYKITIRKQDELDTNTELNYLIPSVGDMSYSNNETEYEIEVGESASAITFSYELASDKATISGVGLRELSYGENIINIIVTAESGATRPITIKVIRKREVQEIKVEKEEIIIEKNEEEEIEYEIIPNEATEKEVEMIISDEEVIEVKDNKIKGIKEGNSTVTIRSKSNPSIEKIITVHVISKKITSKELEIEREGRIAIVIGEEPMTKIKEFTKHFENEESYLKVYDSAGNIIENEETYVGTNMKIKLEIKGEVYDELTIVVRGDLDGNGLINSNDTIIVINDILDNSTLTEDEGFIHLKASDIDGNELVNSNDTIMITNYIIGSKTSLNE